MKATQFDKAIKNKMYMIRYSDYRSQPERHWKWAYLGERYPEHGRTSYHMTTVKWINGDWANHFASVVTSARIKEVHRNTEAADIEINKAKAAEEALDLQKKHNRVVKDIKTSFARTWRESFPGFDFNVEVRTGSDPNKWFTRISGIVCYIRNSGDFFLLTAKERQALMYQLSSIIASAGYRTIINHDIYHHEAKRIYGEDKMITDSWDGQLSLSVKTSGLHDVGKPSPDEDKQFEIDDANWNVGWQPVTDLALPPLNS